MNLLHFNGKNYSKNDLINALRAINIVSGDTLCVHTQIFKLGTPLLDKNQFLSAIIDSFWEVLGKNGTLLMPTFTYSFCKNEVYDKQNSRSTMGILTEFYRKQNGVYRTNDPIFSFAISGAKENLFKQDYKSCFGKGSVYDTLHTISGKIVLFGTLDLGYTFSHYVEEQAKISYRYFKEFSGEFIDENGIKSHKTMQYFVRNYDKRNELSIPKQRKLLQETNNFNGIKFAGGNIATIDTERYFTDSLKAIKKDETSLLK